MRKKVSKKLWFLGYCEVCGLREPSALERHHMIPRTDPNCTEDISNIAVLCGSCHNLVHSLDIILEGRFADSSNFGELVPKLFFHRKGQTFNIIPGIILKEDGTAVIDRG